MQTERGKHSTPAVIRLAVPVSVAGVAVHIVVLHGKIVLTLGVAYLADGNGGDVLRPVIAQIVGNGAFPHCGRLLVCLGVGVARKRVLVLLLIADKYLFITRIRVRVFIGFIKPAHESAVEARIAVCMLGKAAEGIVRGGYCRKYESIGCAEHDKA